MPATDKIQMCQEEYGRLPSQLDQARSALATKQEEIRIANQRQGASTKEEDVVAVSRLIDEERTFKERVWRLEDLLKRGEVVAGSGEIVGVSSVVTVFYTDGPLTGKQKTFQISSNGDIAANRLSLQSPLAQAINGMRVGQEATYEVSQVGETITHKVQILQIDK